MEKVVIFFDFPDPPTSAPPYPMDDPAMYPLPAGTQLPQGHPAKSREDRRGLSWLVCPVCLILPVTPSPPYPGHLSDCSRAPPAKDPAHAGTGPAAASDPCGKAVQTQQPCSVRASLSADICSGLASDGGGAHGPGDSQLASLRACASLIGPMWRRGDVSCGQGCHQLLKEKK